MHGLLRSGVRTMDHGPGKAAAVHCTRGEKAWTAARHCTSIHEDMDAVDAVQCNSGDCLSSAAARFHVRPVMTDEPLLGAGCWVTHTTQTS